MTMRKIVMGLAGIVVLMTASTSAAQMKPMAPEGSQMPMMTPETMAMMCSQMGHRMEHSMMGMQMGPGMMGGMMGASDPKAQGRMLRFRADMMKAMSDVMLKHAAELEKEK
jgi:hypothetical protein